MKCAFIIPYFGKLPSTMPVFLKSCKENPDFTWLIFTDDTTPLPYPDNVRVYPSTMEAFIQNAQEKFGFPVCIPTPHKLCDFKPAYGFLYEEYLREFDFWGYCDIDTVMGKLGDFLTDELLGQYDKLFCLGHMTLFRNTPEVTRLFMEPVNGELLYKTVFQSPKTLVFDEEYAGKQNINQMFLQAGKTVFTKDLSMNFVIYKIPFTRTELVCGDDLAFRYHIEKPRRALYYWDHGHCRRCYLQKGRLITEEWLYFHFQLRNMRFDPAILAADRFRVIPDWLRPLSAVPQSAWAFLFAPTACDFKDGYLYHRHRFAEWVRKWIRQLKKSGSTAH